VSVHAPEDGVKSKIMSWYLDVAREYGAARAGVAELRSHNFIDNALLREVHEELTVLQAAIEALQDALLLSGDLAHAKSFAEAYVLSLKRPGRAKPMQGMDSRPKQYLLARETMDDRLYALQIMLADVKEYLATRGLFGLGERP
jgi:hypothetical protein